MRIAVLPFNAGPNTRAALARQIPAFAAEIAGAVSGEGHRIDSVNYMGRVDENGLPRFILVNPSEHVNDDATLKGFMDQNKEVDVVIDGLLVENEKGGGSLTIRVIKGDAEIEKEEELNYLPGNEFALVRFVIQVILDQTGGKLQKEAEEDINMFGTSNSEAFVKFLQGFDALKYIEQASGQVISQFNPAEAMDQLLDVVKADKDWEAPYMVLTQLCRQCLTFRIGSAEKIEQVLKELVKMEPDDSRALFALGEFYHAIGNLQEAGTTFEKASRLEPEEPAILHRLAMVQIQSGMPVNAERNLRKAAAMEKGPDKPSLMLLANVLMQTGRAHEVPELWNDVIREEPDNYFAKASYGNALIAADRKEEAGKFFEDALKSHPDALPIKRVYAGYLNSVNDYDKAMDLYEDCLEETPNDIPLLMEYANTLAAAKRNVDIPDVLKKILASNPDPNTKAHTTAWLIELEQPKRVEAVRKASEMAEKQDFEGAIKELTPLKNWLGDYWKMWMVLATCYNQLSQHEEAEKAARRTLEMFPMCEPAYVELGNALNGQEKHEEAYALLQNALQNMNSSLPIAVSYAVSAKKAGHPDEARRIAKQIRESVKEEQIEGLFNVLDEIEK